MCLGNLIGSGRGKALQERRTNLGSPNKVHNLFVSQHGVREYGGAKINIETSRTIVAGPNSAECDAWLIRPSSRRMITINKREP